jgi:hypothetical protein
MLVGRLENASSWNSEALSEPAGRQLRTENLQSGKQRPAFSFWQASTAFHARRKLIPPRLGCRCYQARRLQQAEAGKQ